MRLGLISYDHSHLKTEQLVHKYIRDSRIKEITIFALPFKERKKRHVKISHRPDMNNGIPTSCLSELQNVHFRHWDGKETIGDYCDLFVIGGAGVLDVNCMKNKPVVNAHPGIIPMTRGLDSFKWAIYNSDPVGVTLHLIEAQVDSGIILSLEHTKVFSADTICTLARRHYELEIEMLANVLDVLSKRVKSPYKEGPATMRMSSALESEVIQRFDDWKEAMLGYEPE